MKLSVTIFEEGGANFFRVYDGKRWIARVQLNGELTLPQQRLVMAGIMESLNKQQSEVES